MAASCNFLQIPLSRNPISPYNPSTHPRRPFSLSTRSLSSPHHHPIVSSSPWKEESSTTDLMIGVVDPSLRHVNLLFFRSAYNVQIVVDEGEPEEVLLRRFRREVSKAGVIQECKRRRFFENKQEEKKRKAKEASRRNRRRRSGPRFPSSTDGDTASKKTGSADDEDNWEMPVGGLPF